MRVLLSVAILLACAPAVSARMLFVAGQPVPVSSRPRYLATDDIDQDGLADAIVVSTRDTLSILYGSETSQTLFSAPQVVTFGRRLRRPNTGDVNADGITDIVVPDESSGAVWVLLGEGTRGFAAPRLIPVGSKMRPYAVAIGDIDGIGGNDIVVGERRSGQIHVRLNTAAFSFRNGPVMNTRGGLEQIECEDLNGDGLPELISVSAGRVGRVSVFPATAQANGSLTYGDPMSFNTDSTKASFATGDFDNNGTRDLAVLSRTRGGKNSILGIRSTNPDHSVGASLSLEAPCPDQGRRRFCRARGIAAADFDRDGIIDLAIGLRNRAVLGALGTRRSGVVAIMRGRGDTFVAADSAPWLEKAPAEIDSGDFDGDGRPDIVAISKSSSLLQAMRNISSPGPTVRRKRRVEPRR